MPRKKSSKTKLKKNQHKKKSHQNKNHKKNKTNQSKKPKKRKIKTKAECEHLLDEQKQEIECFTCIVSEDILQMCPMKQELYSNIFDIQCYGYANDEQTNHCSVILRVRLPKYYPEEKPKFELLQAKKLSANDCQQLLQKIYQKTNAVKEV